MAVTEIMSNSTDTTEVSTTGAIANSGNKGNGSEHLILPEITNKGKSTTLSSQRQPPPPPPGPEAGRVFPKEIRWPKDIDKLEVIKSPEFELFGKFLVEEIIRLENMPYEKRYAENSGFIQTWSGSERGRYLDRLYRDLVEYVAIIKSHRTEQVSSEQQKLYKAQVEQVNQQFGNQPSSKEQAPPSQHSSSEYKPNELGRINDLLARYQGGERGEAERNLFIYLAEAKRIGLLKAAETGLSNAYIAMLSSRIPPGLTMEQFIEQNVTQASNAVDAVFMRRQPQEHGIAPLAGIGAFYAVLARERLMNMRRGQDSPPVRENEGEWSPPVIEDTGGEEKNYWEHSSSYPEYYNVTATTEDQFIRAKETFLQMIKLKGLGLGPDTVFAHLENFRKAFGSQATEMAQAHNVSDEFAVNIRLEFEGLSYLWGADYANEVYNPEQYKQFMTTMALHEGPQRWVQVARSGQGQVAAHTWKWDKDSRLNLYHNPGGSRGQIANDTVTQNYLQEQIKEIMVEEGMGIVIKDYDPRDVNVNNNPVLRQTRALEIARIEAELKSGKKLDQLSEHDQELYKARQKNIDQIGIHQSDESFKNLYEGFDNGGAHLENWQIYQDQPESEWPEHLKSSIQIGKVQQQILYLKQRVKAGEKGVFTNLDQSLLGRLREMNKQNPNQGITEKEEKSYKDALAKSKDSYEVAFQMIGVSSEKVRKGGGVFYVDRNTYIQAYERLQHFDDKKLNAEQKRAKRVGKILLFLRDAKQDLTLEQKVKTLSEDDQAFYQSLSPEERTDYIDHMPVYMAEKFVQFAENWTKMKYGDDADIWKKPGFAERVKGIPHFRARYRAAMMKVARTRAADQIKRNGFQAKLEWASYSADFLERMEKEEESFKSENCRITQFAAMTVKAPKGEIGQNGKLIYAETKEEDATFQTTQEHWLSRWTSHTYFFYQQENRQMLLTRDNFNQARQIKEGKLRPEDADQLATFLLIIDPTLERVRQMGSGGMQKEIAMMGAAVEESYQSHWRINRNLHRLFLPVDGNPDRMRMGYNREDYGGVSRFAVRGRDLIASQPQRFARRMGALIADLPLEISSMPDIWGADGMLGAIAMMADPIRGIAGQGIASQFALTKYIDQMGFGWELFQALVGKVNGRDVVDEEGLNEKPTNNSDKLQAWKQKGFDVSVFVERENDLLYAFKDSFGRLERVLKIMRVLSSSTRNAQGVLWLEEKDIFLPDGSYNTGIAEDTDTGTSRHSEKIFYETYIKWLISEGPGGGVEKYPDDAPIYAWLQKILIVDRLDADKKKKRTIADWLFAKMGR